MICLPGRGGTISFSTAFFVSVPANVAGTKLSHPLTQVVLTSFHYLRFSIYYSLVNLLFTEPIWLSNFIQLIKPKGDQPQAIETLVRGLSDGFKDQVLLGITGSGKTFTIASVIQRTQRPTLVLAHNKTLAAQLYQEFKSLFPENAVEYFVSYYDYYQPEAYMPAGDVYIEKEAIVNEEIDRLRMSATRALFERRDVIVVASVSCIYGLGDPDAYYGMLLFLEPGTRIKREALLQRLVELQYERSDVNFQRGTFRVRGDVVEVYPSYQDQAFRIELWGEEVDSISTIDPLLGEVIHQTHVARADLSEESLRDVETDGQARAEIDQGRTGMVGAQADRRRQTARSAAPASAHDV